MAFPDGSLDVIAHSHVLEHVPNDERAISEAYRCLAQDGVFLFAVPIQTDFTFVPSQREFHGDNAPVERRNGWDIIGKLKAAGFHVTVLVPPTHLAVKPANTVRATDLAVDEIMVGQKFGAQFEKYRELFYPAGSAEACDALGFGRIPHQLEVFVARKAFSR
jgi:SAM-dependent methyltransferase